MRFVEFGISVLPVCTFGLRIEVNGDVSLPDPKSPEPIMQSFANHLHSVAGLFSSIIGKGNPSNSASFYNPACYLPETEDSAFPNWSGPYCLISYDDAETCQESFNCNFLQSYNIKLPENAKLCCRNTNEPWSSKFQESETAQRVFSEESNSENLPSNGKVSSGHYGLNEIIFNGRVKPESELYLNKFDMGSACKMWGESLGYYSLNPVPESGSYGVVNDGGIELSVCAMERKFDVVNGGKEVPSIMPFCSFKITDQTCPDYAPLFLTFPKNVVSLPNDNLFQSTSFIDSSGLCCSLTQHKTVDRTVVNLDYLPSNWTMNDFQVIKWPYAECPIFEFPKMDLIEHDIEYSGNSEYPWAMSDLKFSMCQYKKPEKKVEVVEKVVEEIFAESAEESVEEPVEETVEETVESAIAESEPGTPASPPVLPESLVITTESSEFLNVIPDEKLNENEVEVEGSGVSDEVEYQNKEK